MKKYCINLIVSALIFYLNCTTEVSVGGGSETTNSLTVCIKENIVSGVAVDGAIVELYCDTFNPITQTLPESLKVTASPNGRYDFKYIKSGWYNIYSMYDSIAQYRRAIFVSKVYIPSDTTIKEQYQQVSSLLVIVQKDDDVQLTVSTLSSIQIYMKGSPFFVSEEICSKEEYTIFQIPAGTYSCDLNYSDTNYLEYLVQDSITITNKDSDYSKESDGSDTLIVKIQNQN